MKRSRTKQTETAQAEKKLLEIGLKPYDLDLLSGRTVRVLADSLSKELEVLGVVDPSRRARLQAVILESVREAIVDAYPGGRRVSVRALAEELGEEAFDDQRIRGVLSGLRESLSAVEIPRKEARKKR